MFFSPCVSPSTLHQAFNTSSYQAATGVSASYDALTDLFECVSNFLRRFHIYTQKIPLSPLMSDILVKILVETLSVLALATKQINQGRFSKSHATRRYS